MKPTTRKIIEILLRNAVYEIKDAKDLYDFCRLEDYLEAAEDLEINID